MAKPTMTMQLDPLSSAGAEGFVRLVSSDDDRTVVAIATASGVAVAGERACKAGRARTVAVSTTNLSATLTGTGFRSSDLGKPIAGTGIPAGTKIAGFTSSTSVTLSDAATATGDVTATVDEDGLLTFPQLNPNTGATDDVIDDPAGTVWRLVITYPEAPTPEPVYFLAPDDDDWHAIAGPYLTSRPGDLPAPGSSNTALDGDVVGNAGANTITASAVTTGKIADDAVTTAKIGPAAVTATELADDAASTAKIAASAVTAAKIAADAVTTVKISDENVTPAKLAGEVAGIFDPLTSLTGWDNAYDYDPVAFDDVQLVKLGNRYWLTCPDPDDGPNNVANRAAAHGARYKDWGSGYADNVRVRCYWSASRPAEATPLIHVVEGTTPFGIGMWPFFDIYPGIPGITSVWVLGVIGSNNTNFPGSPFGSAVLTADELAKYSDPSNPSAPIAIDLVSVNNTVTVWVDGVRIPGMTLTVPVALRGSSTHGIAIDNNQLDGTGGTGGSRPPNFPAACGPFSITPVLADGVPTAPDYAGAPDVREKGATFHGPLKVNATEPTYEPGGVQPVVAFRAEIDGLGAAEIHDQDGTFELRVVQENGDKVSLGSLLGNPSIGFDDGTFTTFARLHTAGEIRFSDDLIVAGAATLEGVNGATAGLRFVGAIATGLPTSGVTGDVVFVRDTRKFHLCTASGTPGTWAGHTHTAAEVSDFNTAVRTNRIDQMAAPTAALTWPSSSLTTNGLGAASSTAADGSVLIVALNGIGGLIQVKSNSADTTATVQLAAGTVSLGPGGAAALDVTFARTGANTATITATSGLTIAGNVTLSARNIITDTTTGLKIGTAATQKLGFFNATPVVQPSGAAQAAVTTTAATQTTPWGYSTQAQADAIVTLVNALRTALVNTGLAKGSA